MYDRLIDIKPIDILIIEDNVADIRLIKEILKKEKMYISSKCITKGIDALKYLKKEGIFKDAQTPDLILLDLGLPDIDGIEILRDIKLDDLLRQIPVIIMTVSKDEEDILRSYRLKASAYMIKPIDIEQLIKSITSIENFWLGIIKI